MTVWLLDSYLGDFYSRPLINSEGLISMVLIDVHLINLASYADLCANLLAIRYES